MGAGIAGTALYEMLLARRSGVWEPAHASAKALASRPVTANPSSAGLYYGAPAVAYVLQASGNPAYAPTLDAMDHQVATLVDRRLSAAYARMASGRPARLREFDLISGLTGIGAYLLRRNSTSLLQQVLSYLVRLITEPVTVDGYAVPGWWASDSPRGRYDEAWPLGHANFGLAHGIAGPLALLGLSHRAGVTVAGADEALDEGCHVLTRWARPLRGGGTGWPETLGLVPYLRGPLIEVRPGRPSWCYGTPGIARSLQLVAQAGNNKTAQHFAEQTFLSCLTDSRQLSRIRDTTVCHGWAGLLLSADRVAADACLDGFDRELVRLHSQLSDCIVRHEIPEGPGLLTGADGVLLTLHTLSPSRPLDPTWQTCLLLS
ncbi:lanthionine synthetase C family protein [Streptomyces sp. LHD-70]|uniref:lanthionine synthetase C family protein n=1 Tax=Streptomyces sp. LHD-70 TaxID=3072140 RepID=UPI00280EF67C|nr:lanthionine synthetase C family protein [Streptomyces sp. LHD-70]MDQ8708229.1 lanthionine synthetase C family protein [Streptomyces sp. LHD-70]